MNKTLAIAALVLSFSAASRAHTSEPSRAFIANNPHNLPTTNEVVGLLRMTAPQSEDFILSATLPVPPGTLVNGATAVPLAVVGAGSVAVPTQVEVVSRYPSNVDGADVVHIMAQVTRPAGLAPGDTLEFEVSLSPHAPLEPEIEPLVNDLLTAPGAIMLLAEDAMGHSYEADLLTSLRSGNAEIQLNGVCARRIKTHEVLLPVSVVPGSWGTLPHMMGVHSYLTLFSDQNFARLDLHVHNGMDGQDTSTLNDDLLDDLYFKDLKLKLPDAWNVAFAFDVPGQGAVEQRVGYTKTELISAEPNNRFHLMPKMSHFVRRLVLYRSSTSTQAQELASSKYVAFSQSGNTSTELPLWSWWNEDTARYYPQNHRLPDLGYIDLTSIKSRLAGELNEWEVQILSGAAGDFPYESPRLGWAHPFGIEYGGMTGGEGINTFDGIKTAWAASQDGIRKSQIRMGAMVDRQTQVLFNSSGNPTNYTDLVVYPQNQAPYVPLWFYNVPESGSSLFDFDAAPQFQIDHVNNAGSTPVYEHSLRSFQAIDYQHFVRYTRDLKTLAWLTNDALSKDLLEAASESYRLSFHEYHNSNHGHVQSTGLLWALTHVSDHPGLGAPVGRGNAWGIDAAVAAYSLGDDDLRNRYLPWFNMIGTLFEEGQSTCTGNLMSLGMQNYFSGMFRVRQVMEGAFLENLLRSMATSVYEGMDEVQATTLDDILVRSVRCSITGRFWNELEAAPCFNNATGLIDANAGNFCWSAPEGTASDYVNRTEFFSSLAYAFEISDDDFFLFRAAQILGGENSLELLEDGLGVNIQNTAGLLALLQDLSSP